MTTIIVTVLVIAAALLIATAIVIGAGELVARRRRRKLAKDELTVRHRLGELRAMEPPEAIPRVLTPRQARKLKARRPVPRKRGSRSYGA